MAAWTPPSVTANIPTVEWGSSKGGEVVHANILRPSIAECVYLVHEAMVVNFDGPATVLNNGSWNPVAAEPKLYLCVRSLVVSCKHCKSNNSITQYDIPMKRLASGHDKWWSEVQLTTVMLMPLCTVTGSSQQV